MATATANRDDGREQPLYRAVLARDAASSMSTAIVKALAAVQERDAADIDLCLYEHIHTEALDHLHEHATERESSWTLRYPVDEYEVAVRSDGLIEIYG